jgi:aryl-alcohol dehydrogenase-like predicted oxidoreductase
MSEPVRKEPVMETITTKGVAMSRLGFGTFRMPGAAAQSVVESALALGYWHIDTAAMYENEAAVGSTIAASGVTRTELFVTTKVWHDQLALDIRLDDEDRAAIAALPRTSASCGRPLRRSGKLSSEICQRIGIGG